jgi:hypothetical protein
MIIVSLILWTAYQYILTLKCLSLWWLFLFTSCHGPCCFWLCILATNPYYFRKLVLEVLYVLIHLISSYWNFYTTLDFCIWVTGIFFRCTWIVIYLINLLFDNFHHSRMARFFSNHLITESGTLIVKTALILCKWLIVIGILSHIPIIFERLHFDIKCEYESWTFLMFREKIYTATILLNKLFRDEQTEAYLSTVAHVHFSLPLILLLLAKEFEYRVLIFLLYAFTIVSS